MPFPPRSTILDDSSPFEPTVEVFQTGSEFIVIAHLPGVVREEVKLSFEGNSMKLKIVGPSDKEQLARMGYYSHEVSKLYGYEKIVEFPAEFDAQQAKATFKHGMLEVRVKRK